MTMEIRYFKNQGIYIKGKKENLWVDPNKEEIADKNYNARIIVFTEKEKNFIALSKEEGRVIINGAGEYEIGGVEISGLKGMYLVTIDGLKVAIVNKNGTEISEKKKEKLEEADVLIIEVGETAVPMAKMSAANYLIPVNYEEKEKELKSFLDAFDKENLEAIESLKVDKDNLPEGMEVVLLKTK